MYFPYLRARRFDFLSVREADVSIFHSGKVIPIIEPAANEKKSISEICKKGINFIFIVNPLVGKATPKGLAEMMSIFIGKHSNVTLGFNVTSSTTSAEIAAFLKQHTSHPKSLIFHEENHNQKVLNLINSSAPYIDWLAFIDKNVRVVYAGHFTAGRKVWIEDSFQKKNRNVDYPAQSPFSNLYSTYTSRGFHGFGDCLTLSYSFTDGGSAPYCVAIHLSKATRSGITIHHFLSDSNLDQKNTAGKYGEAHNKLVSFLNANPSVDFTTGSALFRAATSYPTLGPVKKMSLIHHMELVHSLI